MRQVNKNAIGEMAARIVFAIALVAAVALLLAIMNGCKTVEVTKEVPVVTERVSERSHIDIVRDTLMTRDSIYHYVQGDTVIIERWHRTININNTVVGDTIHDTIPQVVTVTRTEVKEVNFMHWWQKALMWIGGFALVGLAIKSYIKRR